MPKCRYCGQEMAVAYEDRDETHYACSCEEYSEECRLRSVIGTLKRNLFEAEQSLRDHMSTSKYRQEVAELHRKLTALKKQYQNEEI